MEEEGARGRGLSQWILRHRKGMLVVFVVIFLAMTPAAILASNYINYGTSAAAVPGSQSAQAQNLIAAIHPEYSTLFVVVPNTFSPIAYCSAAHNFSNALSQAGVSHYGATNSLCSAYAGLIDSTYASNASAIRSSYAGFVNLSGQIWDFPAAFLLVWGAHSYTSASINQSYTESGGAATGYEPAFKSSLLQNYSSSSTPEQMVNGATRSIALYYFANASAAAFVLYLGSVTTYAEPSVLTGETSLWLLLFRGLIASPALVQAYATPGDPGWNYVLAVGYEGAPALLRGQYLSPDNSTMLVQVVFNVPDSYRGADNFYPAQVATPKVRSLASQDLSPQSTVTGSGAISYDTQSLSSSDSFLFVLTFAFLAIAVLVTLRSLWAPLLTILFIGIGFLLGYFAIFVTGLLLGSVDYLVTYTLEAVILGIVTDYLVFLLYRYREEIRNGAVPSVAIERASETAGFAILTSALIVAVGLGILSFIPGLPSWGPVLFLAVILIGVVEAFFLPIVTSYVGPRMFVPRFMRGTPAPLERSVFYRGSSLAIRRRWIVLAIVVIIAIPALFFTFTAPTSYDVTQSLPQGLQSVQAQNQIAAAFGSNLLYPTYVLIPAPAGTSFLAPNGSLTPAATTILSTTAASILGFSGVSGGNGPFLLGHRTASASESYANTFVFLNGTWAYYLVYSTDNAFSASGMQLIQHLRGNSTWVVGGVSATVLDQKNQNEAVYPAIELALVLLIGIILGIAFRSFSYPVISIFGVFVSISVTVVLLYWITTYLLGQVLIYLIPLILIVILLSLGNDYTVFILSRVVEERKHHPKNEAIPRGIAHSGAVVTSLGIILAVSLGSLGLQPVSFLEQLGIAFAISLVLDTFLIRIFYFPAALSLFSRK